MKSNGRSKNYQLQMLVRFLYVIVICLVFYTGAGRIFNYSSEYVVVIMLLQLILVIIDKENFFLRKFTGLSNTLYLVLVVFLLFNYTYSFSKVGTLPFLLRFFVFGIFMQVGLEIRIMNIIIKFLKKYGTFIAIIYLISFPLFGKNTGILNSYQNQGISMSLASGLFVSDLFSGRKLNESSNLSLILILISLVLTGKRTLFAIPVIMTMFFFIISSDKRKIHKLSLVTLLFILLSPFFLVTLFDSNNVFTRIVLGISDTSFTYRTNFWNYALMLWDSNKIWGIGFGAFPVHILNGGIDLAKYGYIEAYAAHNIYYQLLAECGLVGLSIFGLFFLYNFRKCFVMLRRTKRNDYQNLHYLIYLSIYFQSWFLIYGITGNPIYMVDELFVYMFSIVIVNSVNDNLLSRGSQC